MTEPARRTRCHSRMAKQPIETSEQPALILHGQDFFDILPQAEVLFAYGTVCFRAGVKLFRFRNA